MSNPRSNSDGAPLRFGISVKELSALVDDYKNRKFAEDVLQIREFGGATGLQEKLGVNASQGLSSKEDHTARIEAFGSNVKEDKEPVSFWALAWEAMGDTTMRILLVSGIISLILGSTLGVHPETEWIEGFAIIVAVALVVFVTAANDYQKEQQFRALQESFKDASKVRVLRDGQQ